MVAPVVGSISMLASKTVSMATTMSTILLYSIIIILVIECIFYFVGRRGPIRASISGLASLFTRKKKKIKKGQVKNKR